MRPSWAADSAGLRRRISPLYFLFPFFFFSFRVHSLLHLYFFHDMPRGPRSKAHSMDGVMKRVFSTGSRVQDDKPNGATFLHGLGALASRWDGSRHFCIVCFARCKGALEHNLRGHHGVGLFVLDGFLMVITAKKKETSEYIFPPGRIGEAIGSFVRFYCTRRYMPTLFLLDC